MGFQVDNCIANKTINGKQCTIISHVDDLKISHVDRNIVEDFINKLNERFRQESPLVTSHGKVLEYLGMSIEYTTRGKVKISMYKYIKKMLDELPLDMSGISITPAALHLFNTDDSAEILCEEKAQLFHHLVAKLLYLSCRSRQVIQMAVAFLCTRLQRPDVGDYKKLACKMKYLCGTKDLTLTIKPSDGPRWWVDSSYSVHPDMRSHSGIYMTLGKGITNTTSRKQKLNTKSFTEAELVAIDNSMGQVL